MFVPWKPRLNSWGTGSSIPLAQRVSPGQKSDSGRVVSSKSEMDWCGEGGPNASYGQASALVHFGWSVQASQATLVHPHWHAASAHLRRCAGRSRACASLEASLRTKFPYVDHHDLHPSMLTSAQYRAPVTHCAVFDARRKPHHARSPYLNAPTFRIQHRWVISHWIREGSSQAIWF